RKRVVEPLNRGLNRPAFLTIRKNPCRAVGSIENRADDVPRRISAFALGRGVASPQWRRVAPLFHQAPRARFGGFWRRRRSCLACSAGLGDRSGSHGSMGLRRIPAGLDLAERGLLCGAEGSARIVPLV